MAFFPGEGTRWAGTSPGSPGRSLRDRSVRRHRKGCGSGGRRSTGRREEGANGPSRVGDAPDHGADSAPFPPSGGPSPRGGAGAAAASLAQRLRAAVATSVDDADLVSLAAWRGASAVGNLRQAHTVSFDEAVFPNMGGWMRPSGAPLANACVWGSVDAPGTAAGRSVFGGSADASGMAHPLTDRMVDARLRRHRRCDTGGTAGVDDGLRLPVGSARFTDGGACGRRAAAPPHQPSLATT